MPRTFSIRSLGCKVNQYESQQVRELLHRWGLRPAHPDRDPRPDLIVLHTCCVTASASAKSRRAYRSLARRYPQARVVVCGCLPVLAAPAAPSRSTNLVFVPDREGLAAELGKLIGRPAPGPSEEGATTNEDVTIKPQFSSQIKEYNGLTPPHLPPLTEFSGHARAFLKVQDGCDAHCAYCIIPHVRPRLSSKPLDAAVDEAANLARSGHREIVVTGVCIGSYGRCTTNGVGLDQGQPSALCRLLDRLAQLPQKPRIRLSSLEPGDLTPALVETMAAHETIMPHLHLSLQSGSDATLRRMGRHYTTESLRHCVERLTAALADPAITADVIVGFPGETDQEFAETLGLVRDLGLAKIHVFPFSPRAGTAAARMPGRVLNRTVQERAATLRGVDDELGRAYRDRLLGQRAQVLIEDTAPVPVGRSERYFKVYLPDAPPLRTRDLITATLTGHQADGLRGRVESHPYPPLLETP